MATAAAAAVARARREVQHYFFSHDAVRRDSAVPFEPERRLERRIFERWRGAGVIHEAEPGRYWLDVVAYDIYVRTRFARVRIILLVMIVLLAVGLGVSLTLR